MHVHPRWGGEGSWIPRGTIPFNEPRYARGEGSDPLPCTYSGDGVIAVVASTSQILQDLAEELIFGQFLCNRMAFHTKCTKILISPLSLSHSSPSTPPIACLSSLPRRSHFFSILLVLNLLYTHYLLSVVIMMSFEVM